ncbi:MAG: hypothetical protein IKO26_06580 [Paludibacteraceae bacterium]|nr:hypothetical protein [Paludibacteraceae bacterium]
MITILNIFTPLYKWCPALAERLQDQSSDLHDYFQHYFIDSSVCSRVFLVALLTSLILAVVYYFMCCNISFAAARRYIWAIVLCVCFAITLLITPCVIIGHYDNAGLRDGQTHTFLFNDAKNILESKIGLADDEESVTEAIDNAEQYADLFRSEKPNALSMFFIQEHTPLQMSLVNGLYSILLFFIFSIIFKRFTIHGKAIPF